MKRIYTICLLAALILSAFTYTSNAQTFCDSTGGKIAIFSNYDGGILRINVDMNIPNLKIGIVSYENDSIIFSGPYVSNITKVIYACYFVSPNVNCVNEPRTKTIKGAPAGTASIIFMPAATLSNPNGSSEIICNYSCDVNSSQGGCNTPDQVVDYFFNAFGSTKLLFHRTQYNCWTGTQNLSGGGNCCAGAVSISPVASFRPGDTTLCASDCINFADNSANTPTGWNWSFAGATPSSSTDQNPQGICYNSAGTFKVKLTATNSSGSNSDSTLVTVTNCNSNQGSFCDSVKGDIAIFSNYDGGILTINVDKNIPNLKIGICTYEPIQVTITGAFKGNVTQVIYAGFNSNQNNNNCSLGNYPTSISGVSSGIITINPANDPPAVGYTTHHHNGTTGHWDGNMDGAAGLCDTTIDAGGGNTPDEIVYYFLQTFGGKLLFHYTQYSCWLHSTLNISDGGNCCILPASTIPVPVAAFYPGDTSFCANSCIDFTDRSTNNPTSWLWDFTGATPSSSTDQNPQGICYNTSGTYSANLTVSNAGGSDTQSSTLTVNNCSTNQGSFCDSLAGDIAIFSNYDGGILRINVDMNRPNLKIGIVSYENDSIIFSGPYVSNITKVIYACYDVSNNRHCHDTVYTKTINGAPTGTDTIIFSPPATLNNVNGWPDIICNSSCDLSSNQGGCNTADQAEDYFFKAFGSTKFLFHRTQYDCWQGTQNLSAGGNCCAIASTVSRPKPLFQSSDTIFCAHKCISFKDNSTSGPTSWKWSFPGAKTLTSTDQNPVHICYDSAGIFTVKLTATNSAGSDSLILTDFITVKAAPIPPTITKSNDTLYCGTGYTTYQWSTNSGPISGATRYYYKIPTSGTGTYNIEVGNENGCTIGGGIVVYVGMPSFINGELKFSISPNPVSQLLYFNLQSTANETAELKVIDVVGKVIFTKHITMVNRQLNGDIDVSALAKGIYFLQATTASGKRVKRLVKE